MVFETDQSIYRDPGKYSNFIHQSYSPTKKNRNVIMKKLLLTLLGAAALCGLSPHPASAQDHSLISRTYTTATAKFTDGLVSMGKRVNGAMEGATNTADYTLSNSELQTPTTMPTGQAAHGWGQFQVKSTTTDDEPLIVDFDFTNCSTTPKNDNPAWYQNTAYINTSIYAYTGAKIKLSFNGKKESKPYSSRQTFMATTFQKHLLTTKKTSNASKTSTLIRKMTDLLSTRSASTTPASLSNMKVLFYTVMTHL